MIVKLLTEHHLEFLSLKGGYTGSSESTHFKMPLCWKSHALAQLKALVMILARAYLSFEMFSPHGILVLAVSKVNSLASGELSFFARCTFVPDGNLRRHICQKLLFA